jgi:transposase
MSTANKPAKRPIGRPSKYRPEYCDEIIDLGKNGKSIAQMAAHFDVDKASVFRWAEEHEDFRTAFARAKTHSQKWWEDQAQKNLSDRNFNAQLWLKSVASRFRDDYTERTQTELSGPNGAPVRVESKTVDSKALSQDQRDALRELLMAAKAGKK